MTTDAGKEAEYEEFTVVVDRDDGCARIMECASGELMHPLLDPVEEATALYVGQGLNVVRSEERVVIWDVGLGAAANVFAWLRYLRGGASRVRELVIVSFDRSVVPLTLALNNRNKFSYIEVEPVEALLRDKVWVATQPFGVRWYLVDGDFPALWRTVQNLPHIICYDPFSRAVNPDMWRHQLIAELAHHCSDNPAIFITYSVSTALRAALLSAGWMVADGGGVGRRRSSTVAVSPSGLAWGCLTGGARLLDRAWLGRFAKSSAPVCPSLTGELAARVVDSVRGASQFVGGVEG